MLYVGPFGMLHLDRVCVPICGQDPSLYVWMLRWMAYAATSMQNPFFTQLIGAPDGLPLYWVTTVSSQGAIALPLTMLLGARAAYNLMVLLSCTASASAVYLLCREATGRHWPAFCGGICFILSSYTTYEILHLNLLFTAPLILVAWVTLRYVRGSIARGPFIGGVAVLLLLQFFASLELLATSALFGVLAFGLQCALDSSFRRELARRVAIDIVTAYGIVVLAAAPFLWQAWQLRPEPVIPLPIRSAAFLGTVVPPEKNLLGGFAGGLRDAVGIDPREPQAGAQVYLGIPGLLLLGSAWRNRSRYTMVLVLMVFIAVALSFGPSIQVYGRLRVPGPYALLSWLPLLEHAFPKRLALYAWIALSVLLSMWICDRSAGSFDERRRMTLWILIGVVVLLPSKAVLLPAEPIAGVWQAPRFFTAGEFRWFIDPDDTVLVLGETAQGLDWQVAADMRFRLAEGYLGPYAPWGMAPLNPSLAYGRSGEPLRQAVARREVDWVALPTGVPSRVRSILVEMSGRPSISLDGVDLYEIGARLDPPAAIPSPLAQAAYRRGMAAIGSGNLTEAAGQFRKVLGLRPTNRFAHYQLARIYLAYGDQELAEVHLRAALVENPDFIAPLVELARIWTAERRVDAADELYRRIYLLRPAALDEAERLRAEQLLAGITP